MCDLDPAKFLVFLDRDGTIIEDRHYLSDPDGVVLLPGTIQGLGRIIALGGQLIVITNQSGIGRGYFDLLAAEAVNDRMNELLVAEGVELSGIYLCPHSPDDECNCRKPGTLLFEQAAEEQCVPLEGCYVIGDRSSDVEAGVRLGARTVFIASAGDDEAATSLVRADITASDLIEAADFIAKTRRSDITSD